MKILIGYHTNNNGMGTWCMEAGNALASMGHSIMLIRGKDVAETTSASFPVFLYGYNKKSNLRWTQKVSWRFKYYFNYLLPLDKKNSVIPEVLPLLKSEGYIPDCILLNNTSQVVPNLDIPQLVVAWAWPVTLKGYLSKWKKYVDLSPLRVMRDQYNWFRIDHFAYSHADLVLSVSERLNRDLLKRKIESVRVYPGLAQEAEITTSNDQASKTLVIAAFDLEEKRKRVIWMIEQLSLLPSENWHLYLIGHASDSFRKKITSLVSGAKFLGFLNREALKQNLASADLFLFGSALDDWGFVQVEAMSKGLAILAPNLSPCDEIIGRKDYLYDVECGEEFAKKVRAFIEKDYQELNEDKSWFGNRYQNLFSIEAFSKQLIQAIKLAQTNKSTIN